MKKSTANKLIAYAATLKPGSARAQCYNIAGLALLPDETIAQRIYRDHHSYFHALRAMSLCVDAGCAEEIDKKNGCYGTFIFEDGSRSDQV